MRASALPAGPQLRPGSRAKLRCINLNTNTNFWDDFWGQLWSPTDIIAQLSYYSSVGFNAVKVYCDGMPSIADTSNGRMPGSGYPSDATMVFRIQWFITQCRKYGLAVYLGCNQNVEFAASNKSTSSTLPIIAKFLGWWAAFGADIVVATDLCNEMNGNKGGGSKWGGGYTATGVGSQMITDMQALVAMGRATVPWPITASVFMQKNTNFVNNDYLDLQYTLGLDFHDYHPYFGFLASQGMPAAADMANIRSRAKWLGKALIGECGTGPDVTSDNTASQQGRYAGFQATWVKGMGASAQQPDCYGAVWFCSRPYNDGSTTGSLYGILDANLSNPSSVIVSNVQASWPGGPL